MARRACHTIRGTMTMTLPFDQMSLREKLQMMEQLWDDLVRNPANVPSPAWHKDVLSERERRVSAGSDSFVDWQEAKQQIRDALK